mmetsp:Transcript_2403/g.2465  ORF Transcript_2403/g.2465 Transcript_2403/m.2465 type:complete len:132 (-) Transcript_2403:1749-2144(-)
MVVLYGQVIADCSSEYLDKVQSQKKKLRPHKLIYNVRRNNEHKHESHHKVCKKKSIVKADWSDSKFRSKEKELSSVKKAVAVYAVPVKRENCSPNTTKQPDQPMLLSLSESKSSDHSDIGEEELKELHNDD